MIQTAAFTNLKGGVGKTASAVAIAEALTRDGAGVLLVDLDGQGTLSAWLHERSNACRYLLTTGFNPDEHVHTVPTDTGRLDVITSNRSLKKIGSRRPSQLASRLERLWDASEDAYDVGLVDTPPQASGLVTAALLSTSAALVPVSPGRGSVDGLQHVMEYTSQIGGAAVKATWACNVDVRSKLHQRIAPQLISRLGSIEDGGKAARHYVRSTVRVQEAEAAGELLGDYASSCTAWADYRALTAELGPVLNFKTPEVDEGIRATKEDVERYRAAISN
ncbi:MAG: ParA family protein [Salinibacter sp.]